MRCAATLLLWLTAMVPALAEWRPSAAFPGEARRSIQGCASRQTDDAWACAYVRCEARHRFGFYLDVPGVLADGPIVLAIDGTEFHTTLHAKPANPFNAHRADGIDPGMFAALKTGRILRIKDYGISPGYDVIPLTGMGAALRRLEQTCATFSTR